MTTEERLSRVERILEASENPLVNFLEQQIKTNERDFKKQCDELILTDYKLSIRVKEAQIQTERSFDLLAKTFEMYIKSKTNGKVID